MWLHAEPRPGVPRLAIVAGRHSWIKIEPIIVCCVPVREPVCRLWRRLEGSIITRNSECLRSETIDEGGLRERVEFVLRPTIAVLDDDQRLAANSENAE